MDHRVSFVAPAPVKRFWRHSNLCRFWMLAAMVALNCLGCGATPGKESSRVIMTCGFDRMPKRVSFGEVVINPDVLEFQATDGESLHSPPMIVDTVSPTYPDLAIEGGIQGRVLLNLLIGRSGILVSAERGNREPNPLLVQAAIEAVREWTFTPAKRGGSPVACWAVVEMMFKVTEVREDPPSKTSD